MGQMQCLLHIPGTGGLILMGQKAHHMTLRRGQLHFLQGTGKALVGSPIQNPYQAAVRKLHFRFTSKNM